LFFSFFKNIFLNVIIDKIKEINKFIVASDKPKILKLTFLQDLDVLFLKKKKIKLKVITKK
jgi:hypothetical protein